MTCAAIVIGSAIVGSQLSSTGNLSRVASGVSDEEEDHSAGLGDEPEQARVEPDDEADVTDQDEEFAEDAAEEDGSDLAEDERSESAEDDSSEVAEDESGAESESESEDEGGFAIVRRKP